MTPKHQHLVMGLLNDGIDFAAIDQMRAPDRCVVLSSEGLTNHLYDFPKRNLRDAAAYFSKFDATGLLLHRPTQSWLRSYYVQCTLNPPSRLSDLYATTLRFEAFQTLERVRKLSRYEEVAEDVTKALGLSSICCIDPSENLLNSLSQELGIPAPDNVQLHRANVSPSGHIVELIRQINGLAKTVVDRACWLGIVQAWAQTGNTLMRMYCADLAYATFLGLNLDLLDQLTPEPHDQYGLVQDEIDRFKSWVRQLSRHQWEECHAGI
jgi:hypothetical protein